MVWKLNCLSSLRVKCSRKAFHLFHCVFDDGHSALFGWFAFVGFRFADGYGDGLFEGGKHAVSVPPFVGFELDGYDWCAGFEGDDAEAAVC